ncbi:transcription termination/antitermination protein NusG [Rhizobium sp. 768_B6_N1_8]|uniref:transcription termination/antitermination protein NusG n=1 Tax=unclassified Rhizobium TaxID=2613769 RepID=UPI003F25B831
MTMQHRRSDFDGKVSIKGLLKLDKIADEQRIRISNLAMASRRIIADYPDLCSWYCLKVMTGREFAVEKYLYEENVEALVPSRLGEERRTRHRIIPAPRLPVMPGYVLVQCINRAECFVALRQVKHVIGIIGGGEMPYRIPFEYVEKFRKRAHEGAYDSREVLLTYKLEERVRIIDGPFAAFDATVTAIDGEKHRVTVEASIFGRSTPVELDIAQIEKV